MELDLHSLFGLQCTAVLIGLDPATPTPPSRIWAHLRGHYTVKKGYRFSRPQLGCH
jgi:hypothetical protein